MDAHESGEDLWATDEALFPRQGNETDKLAFLLRYAVLAPSSHNTQPWQFALHDNKIEVHLDFARWLKFADADQRELHVSVGCALENLLIAAEHFGYGQCVEYCPDPTQAGWIATVSLNSGGHPSPYRGSELFSAIPRRYTNHLSYDGRAVPEEHIARLQRCCVEAGIQLYISTDREVQQHIGELETRADAIQFSDPGYRAELGEWIGRGAFGTPWLLAKLGRLAVTYLDMGGREGRHDREAMLSAPAFAILCSNDDDHLSHVRIGQAFERIALTAVHLELALQPMSQILEVESLRRELGELIPVPGMIAQHAFRLGYAAPEHRRTPRRPLDEVILLR